MSGDATSGILKPGQRIKPNISQEQAKQLIQQYYGHKVTKIKELNGYDDNNYYVQTIDSNGFEKKLIFKVLNSLDSCKTSHVEAENVCMLYIAKQGINCPIPEQTLKGDTFALVPVSSVVSPKADVENNELPENPTNHIIRLLQFVDGKLLFDIPITRKLLSETGAYVAQLGNHLKSFTHFGLRNHNTMWMLSSVSNLLQFAYVIQDQTRLKLVQEVVDAFKSRVESAYSKLEGGIVHGDLNEQNILIKELEGSSSGTKEYGINGIIDFGDLQDTYYLFELAITTTYLMLQCLTANIDPFEGSALLLAGYSKHRQIPRIELELLRTCIAGRLCQSVVMGAYTYSQDPGNEYLLTTAKTGWDLLSRIWNDTTDEQLQSIWRL